MKSVLGMQYPLLVHALKNLCDYTFELILIALVS